MKLEKGERGGKFAGINEFVRWRVLHRSNHNRKRMFRLQNGEIQDIVNIVSGEIVRDKFTAIYQSNTLRSI